MTSSWQSELLELWFVRLLPRQWFEKSAELDQALRIGFLETYERERRAYDPVAATTDEKAALAHVLLFDQLPRNIFRDTPRAFESDPIALAHAGRILERALDARMEPSERLFAYLPFEHSEALLDQERSVDLFRALGNAEWQKFAEAHHAIIARFGRFPHRNAILGRPSTPEEIAFVATPGSSF